MITAVIDEELARRVLQFGANDYIIELFDLNHVETCVMVKMIQLLAS
jgi:DNA-binding response OmpR family regulator